ncbi:hypothetical protein DCMF_26085 [Candidatus Formimonas warabiya]|uniref:Uncharacterized protein n=1 Tax=Formimonas warabiya TaxID=1761012 RepID=A0A3G1KZB9_FORW1|nr:hypothetical protein DCMF_26085 [Candidatus Formimonas warabiya]
MFSCLKWCEQPSGSGQGEIFPGCWKLRRSESGRRRGFVFRLREGIKGGTEIEIRRGKTK